LKEKGNAGGEGTVFILQRRKYSVLPASTEAGHFKLSKGSKGKENVKGDGTSGGFVVQ
jgi:hypothetical protein